MDENKDTENQKNDKDFDPSRASHSILTWIGQLEEDLKPYKKNKSVWAKIGREVFARKTLTLAAAKDLENNDISNSLSLAATDVFVEKAQVKLTERANWFYGLGIVVTVLAIATLIIAGYIILTGDINSLIGEGEYKLDNYYVLTYIIFKATTASAILISIVYFLFSIARALFHEATVLLNKRHALRFGRLYVYLKNGHVNLQELESAFKWNEDFTSAFKDIHVDKATKTIWMKLLELPNEIVKTILNKNKKDTKIDLINTI